MTGSLRANAAVRTDRGNVRTLNEDNYCDRSNIGLWAVADGMGGHRHGDRASATIVTMLNNVEPDDFEPFLSRTAEAIYAANSKIYRDGSALGGHSGSTVVVLLLVGNRFALLWAGDSRAYLLRGGELFQLTTDHTQVQEMVDAGTLTVDQARNHPMGHVLVRAVGVDETLELDAITDEAVSGDLFLLCSDGLTGMMSDPEIATVMGSGTPQAMTEALVNECIARGAPDNVTVCVVEISETTLLAVNTAEGADQ